MSKVGTPAPEGREGRRRLVTPLVLSSVMLALLAGYTIVSYVAPNLESRLDYRVLVLTTVVASLLAILYLAFFHGKGAFATGEKAESDARQLRLTVLVVGASMALLGIYVTITFIYPNAREIVSLRIFSFAVVLAALIGSYAIETAIRKRRRVLMPEENAPKAESLGLRFFASLGIYLVLPVYLIATYIFPGLNAVIEMRILILAVTAAALVGLWSVSTDIMELLRILQMAKAITQKQIGARVVTTKGGEMRELADAFNVVISQLESTVRELRDSKDRIEALVSRIGKAISSSGSVNDLLKLMLDISTDALRANRGLLYFFDVQTNSRRLEVVSKTEAPSYESLDKVQTKLQKVIESRQICQEAAFLGVPLCRGNEVLGAIGLEGRSVPEPFRAQDRDMLENIANQAALALEACQLRKTEERIYFEMIAALAVAIEARDPYTRGHSQRVSELAVSIARKMGIDEKTVEQVRDAALLHDIGKIGIPDNILNKSGRLEPAELAIIRQHPLIGEHILRPAHSMDKLVAAVRGHHERIDGKGYPDGLHGTEINQAAVIIGLADVLDAMTSDRPYRKAYSLERAKSEIEKAMGHQFDDRTARAMLELIEKGEVKTHN